mmetsp:Transcript_9273/g.16711  ORF Transcript_9273/g.16711 Transcript_9273/m.16711 type:complete len:679 (-) Transcript_9273:31-2067(-)
MHRRGDTLLGLLGTALLVAYVAVNSTLRLSTGRVSASSRAKTSMTRLLDGTFQARSLAPLRPGSLDRRRLVAQSHAEGSLEEADLEGEVPAEEHHKTEDQHEEEKSEHHREETGHGGHGKEHDDTSPASVVIADMLFGFLILDVLLLHLVKWGDPQVRGYMYKMISSTMSIFCAVLINEAFVELSFEALSRLPVAMDDWTMEILIGVFTFSFFLACLNFWCYKTRKSRNSLYAVQAIFAHLAAFAGILTFESIQVAVQESFKLVCVVVILAGFFLMIAREITRYIREKAVEHHRASVQVPASELITERRWRESIEEGEDDATALILSYLLQQVIAQAITGQLHSHHSVESELLAQQEIFGAAVVFAVLLMILTVVRADSDDNHNSARSSSASLGSNNRRDCCKRVLEWLQTFCSMSMGWCLLRAGVWTIGSVFPVSSAMTQVLNAFVMSGVVVVLTIALDKCADMMVASQEWRRQRTGGLRTNSSTEYSNTPTSDDDQGEAVGHQQSLSLHVAVHMEGGIALWGTQVEKSLRAIISGFGLAVAICWEHAFEAAGETMMKHTAYVEDHPAIAKGIMAAFVALVVLPAWVAYIVPMARKSWSDHQASINMESLLAGGKQNPGDDVKLAALEVAEKAFMALPNQKERRECQELIDKLRNSVTAESLKGTRTFRMQQRHLAA